MEYRRVQSATAPASAFSKKLVNGHSFSGKSLYEGVFAAPTTARSGVEDYSEIFGGPGSSIPLLDIPELNERKVPVDVRGSKLDYSEIFGGFEDFEFAVSHEDLFARRKKNRKALNNTGSRPEGSCPSGLPATNQVLSNEASNKVLDGGKEYKMSYNKTRSTSKIEVNGVTPVAELHAVSGYACLVDENGPTKMKGAGKRLSSVLSDTSRTVNYGGAMMENGHCWKLSFDVSPTGHCKQTSGGDSELKNKCCKGWGTDLNDRLFEAYEIGSKSHQEKVPHVSRQNNAAYKRGDSQVSIDPNIRASSIHSSQGDGGVSSPTYLDEELDTNSDAAASASAVRKAIEEAQVRLKLAKEMMERKKEGHQPCTKPISNGVMKSKRKESRGEGKANKFRERENCNEMASPVHAVAGIEKLNVIKEGLVTPDSDEREKLSSATEAVGNLIISQANHWREEVQEPESEKETDEEKKCMPSFSDHKEIKTSEKQKEYDNKLETVEKSQEDFEKKLDSVKGNYDPNESEGKLKSVEEIHNQRVNQTRQRLASSSEEPENEISRKPAACEGNFEKKERPTENLRELEVLEREDKGYLERLKYIQGLVENQRSKKSVLKHESLMKSENLPEMEENEIVLEILMLKEFQKRSEEAYMMAEQVDELKEVCGPTENEEKQDICNADINEMVLDKAEKPETITLRQENFINEEEAKEKHEDEENHDSGYNQEVDDDMLKETFHIKETNGPEEISERVETERLEEEIVVGAEERKAEVVEEEHYGHKINFNLFNGVHKQDELEKSKHEESFAHVRERSDFVVHEGERGMAEETEAHSVTERTERESKSVVLVSDFKETMEQDAAGFAEVVSESDESMMQMENAKDSLSSDKSGLSVHITEMYLDQPKDDQHAKESSIFFKREGHLQEVDCESGESNLDIKDDEVAMAEKGSTHDSESSAEGGWVDDKPNLEDNHTPFAAEMKSETKEIDHMAKPSQNNENGVHNRHGTQRKVEREAEDCSQREVELEKEQKSKIDEEKERKREREKERIAVERAIREARERAFTEARERAERAAAGKANEQAHQKVVSGACGKLEKASAEANDKAFLEAKLKAERAAVERATAEARKRALQKALSEKTSFKSRNHAEKLDADKFCSSFRDNVVKQTVNDSHHKGSGSSGNSGHSSAANQDERFDGTKSESALRCKARMERHQRTAERAAKALAEKNMRDLLAQREQAERNRLAGSLELEVKRWSSGKEKNLRALLSTLQYILGPDSGWQPIPLTDIITTAAVRKAYRRATLFVHPDKLQQRGATIKQKYVCEKVFDLLKEAWNRFNTEER